MGRTDEQRGLRGCRLAVEGARKGWALKGTGGPLMYTLQTTKRTFYLVLSTVEHWGGFRKAIWRTDYIGGSQQTLGGHCSLRFRPETMAPGPVGQQQLAKICSDSMCVLKSEPVRLAVGSVLESDRKKVAEKDSNCFYSKGNALYWDGEFSVW